MTKMVYYGKIKILLDIFLRIFKFNRKNNLRKEKRMNRIFIILLSIPFLMSIIPTTGHCKVGVDFGVKFGLAITNHWSSKEKGNGYDVESSTKTGFAAGVSVNYELSNIFKLQPELLYVNKGSEQTVTVPGFPYGDINVTYKLDYVEIPVLLKTYPFRMKKLEPYSAIGPYFSFLVNDKYEFENQFLPNFEKDIEDIKDTDFGMVFGTGVDFSPGFQKFSFEYRYTMGFIDLKLPTGPGFPEIELRNNCHSFLLSIFY